MWSLFSRSASASFQYDVGDPISPGEGRSVFTLHHAKKKGCGTPVSAFVCQGLVHNNTELELARSAVQRLKTLRHPCILEYVDSLESDKAVYLITPPVTPLITWLLDTSLSADQKTNVLAWGTQQILRAISFLNNDGNLEHCNVNSSSVFVTMGGEWKLAGLEFCRAARNAGSVELPPNRIPPSLAVYDAPEKTNQSLWKDMKPWSTDSWGVGCLMWEVFNLTPLVQSGALRNTTKLPAPVTHLYKQLLSEQPGRRPKSSEVLEQLGAPGCFLDNSLIHTIDFLENIHIRQNSEKQVFFSRLSDELDNIPIVIVKYKILPAVVSAQQFSNLGSMVLRPLLKMSEQLSEPEYQRQVLPTVVQLFASPDRATRLQLLQQMDILAPHMDAATINDKVFPHLCTGFLDANPSIREHTIKSILPLAPKLSKQLLNIEVMKHFAKLQAKDEQGGIRTNCTVCLGKIAPHLSPTTRSKCLISAFTRALKDPFPPARGAGVMALATTQHFYPVDQVALRIVPSLSLLTLDPEKSVRDVVFRVLKGFLSKLEKLSENPSLKEEMEREVMTESTSGGGAAGWAGWAVGALTSKFYKSNISDDTGSSSSATAQLKSSNSQDSISRAQPSRSASQSSLQREAGQVRAASAAVVPPPATQTSNSTARVPSVESYMAASEDTGDKWSDDGGDWQAMENLPSPESESGWENDNWDPLEIEPEPVTKLASLSSNSNSNWSSTPGFSVDKDERAALREQKKDDRQKQVEAKRAAKAGPLKLGMKKT